MSTGTLSPTPKFTGLDNEGNPLVGGKVFTYQAGTTTPATTYTDQALTVPNTNPIILDAGGRATVYLAAASYKFIVKDADGATIYSQDDIQSVGSIVGSVPGEIASLDGSPESQITGTSYPSGATYDKLHAGTSTIPIDSADILGSVLLDVMLLTQPTGDGNTVTVGLFNLTDAPDTAIVEIAVNDDVGGRHSSVAIPFAAAGATKVYGIKSKVSAGYAYAWSAKLRRA